MIVYYGDSFNIRETRLLSPPITNLLKEALENKQYGNYLRCPAAVNYLKNIYVVRSPTNFKIEYNHEKNIYQDTSIPENVQACLFPNHVKGDECLMQLNFPQYTLFSEQTCYVTLLPPFMHKSTINNFSFVPGTFDVSKWFRPIHLALYNPEKNNICIRRDEPIFYMRIETQDKVNLQEYNFTEACHTYSQQCSSLREINQGMSLKWYYKRFTLRRANKKIIKEIKDNLL